MELGLPLDVEPDGPAAGRSERCHGAVRRVNESIGWRERRHVSKAGRHVVKVEALGAASLEGGTLTMTPLFGADGEIYAIAQGAVSVGGFNVSGGGGGLNPTAAAAAGSGAVTAFESLDARRQIRQLTA